LRTTAREISGQLPIVDHKAILTPELARILAQFNHIKELRNLRASSGEDSVKLANYLDAHEVGLKDNEIFSPTLQNILLEYPKAYKEFPIVYALIRSCQFEEKILWVNWDTSKWLEWMQYGDPRIILEYIERKSGLEVPHYSKQPAAPSHFRSYAQVPLLYPHPDVELSDDLFLKFAQIKNPPPPTNVYSYLWRYASKEQVFTYLQNHTLNSLAVAGMANTMGLHSGEKTTIQDYMRLAKLLIVHPNKTAEAFTNVLRQYASTPNIYNAHKDLKQIIQKVPDVNFGIWTGALVAQSFGEYKINRAGDVQSNFTHKRLYKKAEFFDVLLKAPTGHKERELTWLINLALSSQLPAYKKAEISLVERRRLALWLLNNNKVSKKTIRALDDV
jgi:hypothetical protein